MTANAPTAADAAAPGGVDSQSGGISLPTRPIWSASVRPWHVGVAIAVAAGAAAITVTVLGTGGIGRQSLPGTEQASMLGVTRVARDAPAALAVDRWTDANSARWVGNYRRSIAFELTSENTASAGLARVRPILVVRCLANDTEVFVYTQWPAAIEPQDDRRTIHVSFDGETGSTERWFTSPDRDALFAPDAVAFARRLGRGQRLRFGFTPHNGRPETVQFNVSGFSAHLASVARLCKWKQPA